MIDELARCRYGQELFDMAVLGLRLGDKPRMCIATTPRPTALMKNLVTMHPRCAVTMQALAAATRSRQAFALQRCFGGGLTPDAVRSHMRLRCAESAAQAEALVAERWCEIQDEAARFLGAPALLIGAPARFPAHAPCARSASLCSRPSTHSSGD